MVATTLLPMWFYHHYRHREEWVVERIGVPQELLRIVIASFRTLSGINNKEEKPHFLILFPPSESLGKRDTRAPHFEKTQKKKILPRKRRSIGKQTWFRFLQQRRRPSVSFSFLVVVVLRYAQNFQFANHGCLRPEVQKPLGCSGDGTKTLLLLREKKGEEGKGEWVP